MAIRHREVFPEGSSPDSIDWRVWNDDHIGAGGDADFSAVAEDILPATDDTFDIGSPFKRWAEGHFSDFVKIGTDPYWQIFSDGRLRLETISPEATRIDIGFDGAGNEGFHWLANDIAGLSRIHIDYNDGVTNFQMNGPGDAGFQVNVQPDGGYIEAKDAGNIRFKHLWNDTSGELIFKNGADAELLNWIYNADQSQWSWKTPAGADFAHLRWEAGVLDLMFDDLPATDPAVASQIFTMDAAGVGAALAAGARYLLVSGGP